MKKITSLLVYFVLIAMPAIAQNVQIVGKVVSDKDGSELPGVSVVVKGTTEGTITDINGDYSISAPSTARLVFSFIGMETREVTVGTHTTIDIVMLPDVMQLEAAIVTAFGIKKEKKAITYSSETVSNKQINQAAQTSLTNSIQGKVAGVTVRQSSGMPGASSYILIRGAASIDGNNQPLFVVDGMPIESSAFYAESGTTQRVDGTDASSRSIDINPADIESVEVLKGFSAAALYGLRASNGAILITTKSGKENKVGQSSVNFSTSYTVDKVTRTPDLQSKYAQGDHGNFVQTSSNSWGPEIDDIGSYYNVNKQDTVNGARYDNVSPLFDNGATYTVDLSLSKSSELGNYNLSLGYLDQKGVMPNSGMTRFSGKISGGVDLSDKISASGTAMYTNTSVDKVATGANLSNPLFTTYFAPISYDLWGTPYANEDDPYKQIHYRSVMDNPLWSLENNRFFELNDRIISSAKLEYNILPFLKLQYQLGVDYISNQQKEVLELGSGATGGRSKSEPSGGKLIDFSYVQREANSNMLLAFDKQFSDFTVNGIFGSEFYQQYSRELKTVGYDFNLGGYHNIANTNSQSPSEYIENRRTIGFYGSAQVDYKSIVYLLFTGRKDIVSYLAEGNRDFNYPSVGASFIFTELFDDPTGTLSFGKLRASWAEVGQAVPYTYGTQNIYYLGGAESGYLNDGIEVPLNEINAFTNSNVLYSEDLKPQTSKTTEIGIDLKFLRGLFGIDYTFYTTLLEDQIFEVPIAPSSGYTAELRNAGVMKNVGHEIIINSNPITTNEFAWNINLNFTKYNNTVEELAEGVSNIYLGGFSAPSTRAVEGESYPSIYGSAYLRDKQGEIVMLDDPDSPYHGMPLADVNTKKIGDVQSDFFIGFTNQFTYKSVVLTAQFDWNQGGEMYSGNNTLGRSYGMTSETEDRETKVVLQGVKGHIDNTTGELVVSGKNDIAIVRGQEYWSDVMYSIDEANVYETSYIRFRELSVGYTFPEKLLNNTFIKGATLSIIGRNLALWTSYPNFDPETSTTGAVNGQGIEYVASPQTKSFGGKLSITF